VVDVRDDRKISNVLRVHYLGSPGSMAQRKVTRVIVAEDSARLAAMVMAGL
jgi:hypothetical protein